MSAEKTIDLRNFLHDPKHFSTVDPICEEFARALEKFLTGKADEPPRIADFLKELEGKGLPENVRLAVQNYFGDLLAEGSLPKVPGHEVRKELGRGGMGVVYLAWQSRLDRLVALKMLLGSVGSDAEARARFRVEAAAAARLQHPNIVQIFEVGEVGHRPYLSLELVEGGSLESKLAAGPLEPLAAAQLVEVLARAVHAAHEKGVVHRDLKPANILLAADGTPKVTDFGLAKILDDDAGLSVVGQVLGTPRYMAPEQAAGTPEKAGPAADVYALGVILYECLTGQPPFKAATVLETLELVRSREPAPPSRLQPKTPRDLETICLKCLQKDPRKRYASAEAVRKAIADYLQGLEKQGIKDRKKRAAEPANRRARWWRRGVAATVLVNVLGGGCVAAWATWQRAEYEGSVSEGSVSTPLKTQVLQRTGRFNEAKQVLADAESVAKLRKIVEATACGCKQVLADAESVAKGCSEETRRRVTQASNDLTLVTRPARIQKEAVYRRNAYPFFQQQAFQDLLHDEISYNKPDIDVLSPPEKPEP